MDQEKAYDKLHLNALCEVQGLESCCMQQSSYKNSKDCMRVDGGFSEIFKKIVDKGVKEDTCSFTLKQ